MKGKIIYILSFILVIGGLNAQTLIGKGKTDIHDGAILELVSSGQTNGLLLPQVVLTNAAVWLPVDGAPQNGMVVYNTNNTTANDLKGTGAYVWTDGRWLPINPIMNPCNAAPAQPGTITFNSTKIEPYQSLVAYVAPVAGATSYEWTLPEGLIGSSNTNFIVIIGWKEATHNAGSIKVKALNDCGNSNEKLSDDALVVEKANQPPTVQIDNSGNASLQGPTCFDVAMTEGGTDCGSLSSRKQTFPNEARRTRAYVLSLMVNTSIKDLRVGFYDDADGIIKSITGNKTGALGNTETITVVFADDINTIVQNSGKSTVKIYAIYSDHGTDKRVELTIKVQDCVCCPLNVAKIVENTVYTGRDAVTGTTSTPTASGVMSDLTKYFTHIPNSALCVYKTDNKPSNAGDWYAAELACKNLNNSSTGEDGWRLPNIAEIVAVMEKQGVPVSDMNVRYWSSTRYINSGTVNPDWGYFGRLLSLPPTLSVSFNSAQRLGGVPAGRCVKTISY
ncbi:hypothetical protein FACS1894181_15900 [Bacteroidia bacterium]|nr:hypothetical protein FACS1894181_15900 [Bacteroidia bacterium]